MFQILELNREVTQNVTYNRIGNWSMLQFLKTESETPSNYKTETGSQIWEKTKNKKKHKNLIRIKSLKTLGTGTKGLL